MFRRYISSLDQVRSGHGQVSQPNVWYSIEILFQLLLVKPWFNIGILSRARVVKFTILRLGHNRLLDHSYFLGFEHSPLYTLHYKPHKRNITYLIITYSNLSEQRKELFMKLKSLLAFKPLYNRCYFVYSYFFYSRTNN